MLLLTKTNVNSEFYVYKQICREIHTNNDVSQVEGKIKWALSCHIDVIKKEKGYGHMRKTMKRDF